MNLFEKDYAVQVCDIGSNNQLSNYGLMRILQEAASVHSDVLGMSVNNKHITHMCWIIINWRVKILKRLPWNKIVHVKTWPSITDKLYSQRDFELYSDNELIAIASSKWILVNPDTGSIRKIDDDVLKQIKPYDKEVFDSPYPKLAEPEHYDTVTNYIISRRDIDTNMHTNNLSYILIANEALPENVYNNIDLNNIEVLYKRECKLGEEVSIFYTKTEGNEYVVTIKSKDLSKLHCIIKFVEK